MAKAYACSNAPLLTLLVLLVSKGRILAFHQGSLLCSGGTTVLLLKSLSDLLIAQNPIEYSENNTLCML